MLQNAVKNYKKVYTWQWFLPNSFCGKTHEILITELLWIAFCTLIFLLMLIRQKMHMHQKVNYDYITKSSNLQIFDSRDKYFRGWIYFPPQSACRIKVVIFFWTVLHNTYWIESLARTIMMTQSFSSLLSFFKLWQLRLGIMLLSNMILQRSKAMLKNWPFYHHSILLKSVFLNEAFKYQSFLWNCMLICQGQ